MSKVLQMPDETKEQINDKIKCFLAENFQLRDRIAELTLQFKINDKHIESLIIKYRNMVLPTDSGGDQ